MSLKWMRLLQLAILLVLTAGGAQAATFSCSLGAAPNYTQNYSSAGNSSTAQSVIVTCVKAGGGGGRTINYTVTPNNGLNASGAQNRAALGGQFINYDIYTAAACAVPWTGSGSIVMPGGGGATRTQTLTYFGCVPASQPALPAAGTYNDTVSLTLAIVPPPAGTTITGINPRTFQANITVSATCVMATPQGVANLPGTIAFGIYTAFQGTAKTANTTFGTTCTNSTPYTLSLDAYGGVVSGLNYSLLLSTSSSGGSAGLGATGTGALQTFFINGSMPASQAGACAGSSCPGTSTHFLTVTY